MATTQEILTAAGNLGKLIATHPSVAKLEELSQKLQQDVAAQRLMTDLNRHMETLAQKQQQGQPIEVADKHKLDDLQRKVVGHALLGQLQMAQMDYLDLMRQVDAAITPASEEDLPAAGLEGALDGGVDGGLLH